VWWDQHDERDMLLVHCTFDTEREWELLREHGVSVSVCPETEMQMGMGFPAIREATRYTAGPGIAIDCVSGTGGGFIPQPPVDIPLYREHA
jgi:5-methylthioadenosine/S-adenosylhomocysteine deaminase